MHIPDHILLIRPAGFGYNPETAASNAFQQKPDNGEDPQVAALREFDGLAAALRREGIRVTVYQDRPEPPKPDAIFPNNWISFHTDGTAVLYPMCAPNRRLERDGALLANIGKELRVRRWLDLSRHEAEGRFLEGTGSIVLDRRAGIAYACASPRTDRELFHKLCAEMGWQPFYFPALDRHGTPIYHTNVMLALATGLAIVCLKAVPAESRQSLADSFRKNGREIVEISHDQMEQFAANLLEVQNGAGIKYLVMSSRAFRSFSAAQRRMLERGHTLLHVPLDAIETYGGGSARCMMAEVFSAGPENSP